MLSWPSGPRSSDGAWAPHWYASVEASTDFAPYVHKDPVIPGDLAHIIGVGMPIYGKLAARKIEPEAGG